MNRRTFFSLTAIALASSLAACNTAKTPTEAASKRQEINTGVDSALNKLYSSTPGSREQASKAKGILVFPSVIAAGLVVGGEYGEGALRSGGTSIGYYKTSTASFGLQIGAQSKAVIMMFMTQDALINSGPATRVGPPAWMARLRWRRPAPTVRSTPQRRMRRSSVSC